MEQNIDIYLIGLSVLIFLIITFLFIRKISNSGELKVKIEPVTDSFEIKEISFTANPSNIDLLPLNVILASIGQQSLTLDLNTYSEVFDKGLMLKIISKLGYSMAWIAL